ncbi:Sua5/YciO/YrdC/YwlC family protein [Synechococcus sp. RSCCF101]|uniref:L-threonylcarbamoyladenylate synthase n=1 Tax=Synechococcus sp. RSCCF101 TaxID=2511069 RepID=UPI0012492380|nr:Sua5/YciO/YrdC/YwlC family protein [Synechococcus sp. RSCCF101]QEY32110.1 Sua5/YciO/YrdC/YwlC family protein [Synechococcus sp. RSCCF101]
MARACSADVLAEHLASGSPALFPTDTVPALAAAPGAVAQLWALKERPRDKPLILMGAAPEVLFEALEVPVEPAWRDLVAAHWPGPLTLVLPARGACLNALNPGGSCLGLRIPASAAALALLRQSGPLATTSANRSAQPPCLSAAAAQRAFPDVPLLAPLPWPAGSGLASTVVVWQPDAAGPSDVPWRVLRQGSLRLEPAPTAATRTQEGG